MEDQGSQWPFIHLDGGGSSSQAVCEGEDLQNQYYDFVNDGNESTYLQATLPQYNCQQTPLSYFDFLPQSGGTCETREEVPLGDGPLFSGFGSNALSLDKFGNHHQMAFREASNEGSPVFDLSGSECQVPFLNFTEEHSPASSFKTPRRSKEKAVENDRRRRLRISDALDALQELLPVPTKKCLIIDNIADRIVSLQLQIKELSKRRLGAEFSSSPLHFVEGHGHYQLSDHMQAESMEEMIGKLFRFDPSTATQLLDSRGLYIRPVAFTEGLPSQT